MPNKNHRTVKMSNASENKPVSVWRVFAGVFAAALAASFAIVCGFGTGALALFVVGPSLIWAVWGTAATRSALISAIIAGGGLFVLQAVGAIPPAAPGMIGPMTWLSPVLLFLSAILVMRSLGRRAWERDQQDVREAMPTTLAAELPEDGPLLVVDVSPLNRVRGFTGAASLFPDLQIGQVAERVLLDLNGAGLTPGRTETKNGQSISVYLTKKADGDTWFIVHENETVAEADNDLAQQLRERTDFFAGLGHDLKSPLNAVIGFSDMMESEILGEMPEAYKEYPGLIRESGETLLRFVEDMLGYARSEAGTYEVDLSPVDVTASAEAVIRQAQASAQRAQVKLELKSGGEVLAHADAGAIQRIWDNLVSNAIKYSEPGGVVTLAAKYRGGTVSISVTDRGAGMDADDLSRIAKPFEQGRNARGRAGTGLGLAMVQRLADMHGGKMVIRTAPGEGTQVTISLPAAAEAGRNAAE